jgi:acetyltransferase-like isoleucine patch superfamily enzyme
MSAPQPAVIHPTALVEAGVTLGTGTKVWDNVHIRRGARIGHDCIVGEKSYVAYDVVIGDFVKINASVYICAGVEVGDFCMLSAHVVFTNDRFPRAGNEDLTGLETSDPTEETLLTRLGKGVTVGANATIGPGLNLGEFSMVGMGSVVAADVAPYSLVFGNPARHRGWVCACGHPLLRMNESRPAPVVDLDCARCHRSYLLQDDRLHPQSRQIRRTA